MWEMLKSWFKSSKAYLATVFLISAVAGFAVALLAVIYPPVLSTFAGLSLLGWAPLAFLNSMNTLLGALTLSSIITAVAFVATTGGAIFINRLLDIGSHLYELFKPQESVSNALIPDSMTYMRSHLESVDSHVFDIEEDSDEFQDDTSFEYPFFNSAHSAHTKKAEQTAVDETMKSDLAFCP